MLILFQCGFTALDRSQLPALMVLADLKPEYHLGRLIQKYSEPLIVACDGADQSELRTLGFPWYGHGYHFRDRGRRDRWRRRPPGR